MAEEIDLIRNEGVVTGDILTVCHRIVRSC